MQEQEKVREKWFVTLRFAGVVHLLSSPSYPTKTEALIAINRWKRENLAMLVGNSIFGVISK